MTDGLITWVLAFLESASLGKHLGPAISRIAKNRRFRRALREATTAFFDDPAAQFIAGPCADTHMLRQVYHLRESFFQEATGMTEDAVLQRYHHCPRAFHTVMRVLPTERAVTLEGYFVLLPISDGCVDAIARGQIEAGRHIRETDIVTDGRRIRAAYISVVCGNGPRAQRATVNALIAEIDKLRRSRGLRFVFVRPTTTEGSKAVRRYANRDLSHDGRIERIDLSLNGPSMDFPTPKKARLLPKPKPAP